MIHKPVVQPCAKRRMNEPKPLVPRPRGEDHLTGKLVALSLMVLALLLITGCSGGFVTQAPTEEPAAAAPTIGYQMVQVKTRTPTPVPDASAGPVPDASAGPVPDASAGPLPVTPQPKITADQAGTATSAPLITPSATTQAGTANSAASVPRISLQAAKASLDAGTAVLVDVRTAAAYQQSHAVGAISMPSNEVDQRYKELPVDKQIILYCA